MSHVVPCPVQLPLAGDALLSWLGLWLGLVEPFVCIFDWNFDWTFG